MTDIRCDHVRERVALGEDDAPKVREHVRACAACGREAAAVSTLVRALAAGAAISPPPAVDRAVRAMLAAPATVRTLLRPAVALGFAAASMLALLGGLGSALAETGAAENGVYLAVGALMAYLAGCTAAALPVVILRAREAVR